MSRELPLTRTKALHRCCALALQVRPAAASASPLGRSRVCLRLPPRLAAPSPATCHSCASGAPLPLCCCLRLTRVYRACSAAFASSAHAPPRVVAAPGHHTPVLPVPPASVAARRRARRSALASSRALRIWYTPRASGELVHLQRAAMRRDCRLSAEPDLANGAPHDECSKTFLSMFN